jgi:hypothetical protein
MSQFITLLNAVRGLVTDEEITDALADMGHPTDVLTNDSVFTRGILLGIRSKLDPTFSSMLEALGVSFEDFSEATNAIKIGSKLAELIQTRRERPTSSTPAKAVPGLSALGDLDGPGPVRAIPEVVENDYVFGGEGVLEEGAREIVIRPVEVYCEISTGDSAKALEAAEAIIPSLAVNVGAYEVGDVHTSPVGTTTVQLRPLGDSEEWACALPNGTTFFDNPVPLANGESVATKVTISGEIDPENPPLEIDATIAEMVAVLEAFNGPIDRPATMVLMLERTDGRDFTEAQLAAPLAKAVTNLQDRLGPITVTGTEVGETGAIRLAHLQLNGQGTLDPRGFVVGAVGFKATLPFEGIGRVTAAIVG